jgi:hypothetical protein
MQARLMRAVGGAARQADPVQGALNDRVGFRVRRAYAVVVNNQATDLGAMRHMPRRTVVAGRKYPVIASDDATD